MRLGGRAWLAVTLVAFTMGLRQAPPADSASKGAEPAVLLYDTLVDESVRDDARRTGAKPLLLIYQYTSPDSARTGDIAVLQVIDEIGRMTGGDPPAWGMLDFEYGFTDRLQRGAQDPAAQHATSEMVQLIRSVKRAFPMTKWTFYGVPFLEYWIDHRSWDEASDDQKRQALQAASQAYGPIVAECDWISPSIYPVYDPAEFPEWQRSSVRRAGVAWRRAQVAFAQLLAKGKPVIPTVSPAWQPNGKAPAGCVVPPVQFIEDQVAPAIRAGAAGVAIWTSYDRIIKAACAPSTERPEANAEFPRANLARAFLDGASPIEWSAPEVADRMRSRAARVVLRALRDVRAWEAGRTPDPSAAPW